MNCGSLGNKRMNIPSYFIPIKAKRPKATKRKTIPMDKAESNSDAKQQETVNYTSEYEERRSSSGDRRKRNIKPLIDTRSGVDRRYDKKRQKIDTKA